MKFKDVIGLDMSKLTIDVVIHSTQTHFHSKNKRSGFKSLVKRVYKKSKLDPSQIIFILEHTGMYSHQICTFFSENNIPFVIVPGLAIKRSMGITRGKDDKIDAIKIALYGYRRLNELVPCTMPKDNIQAIKRLLGLRSKLVKHRTAYISTLKESKRIFKRMDNEILFSTHEKMIHQLNKQICVVEKELDKLLQQDDQIHQMYELIRSIKGIGKQTALHMIAYTEGFTKFKTARQFASYCGVAPFPNSSGTSLNGKTKVSHLAYKKIKSLLDLCAKSAIQFNPELKKYYHKRIKEGKNKSSTINVIRNKLITRMFAVIKRKTPYVDILGYAS